MLSDYDCRSEYNCDIYNEQNIYVGYCKYYKPNWYDDIAYIEYIFISDIYRRRGYATKMVEELNNRYELKWDYKFTDMGRLWYESMCKKDIIKTQ
jgi:ribosomal protein S18 acetylase RimI-like enzyme